MTYNSLHHFQGYQGNSLEKLKNLPITYPFLCSYLLSNINLNKDKYTNIYIWGGKTLIFWKKNILDISGMAVSDCSNLSSEAKRYYGMCRHLRPFYDVFINTWKRENKQKQRERDWSRCQETSVDLKSSNKKPDNSYWKKWMYQ